MDEEEEEEGRAAQQEEHDSLPEQHEDLYGILRADLQRDATRRRQELRQERDARVLANLQRAGLL